MGKKGDIRYLDSLLLGRGDLFLGPLPEDTGNIPDLARQERGTEIGTMNVEDKGLALLDYYCTYVTLVNALHLLP